MRFKTNLKSSLGGIDMTPLVNVVFLMLVFFLVTSDVLPLKSLHVEAPQLPRDAVPLTTQLLVVMDAQNVIYLGPRKDIVDLASLKEHLSQQIASMKKNYPGADPAIVLSIDRRVDYGSFLKLFAIAQDCSSRIRLVFKPELLPILPDRAVESG